MSQTRALLEAWRQQNPGLFKGLQQAISRAEGTWRSNQPGYNILFGGGTFNDYSRHPDRVVRTPGYASAAAGAYQFMPGTYEEAARALGLKDFSPASQDLAMLYKVRQRLMPAGGLAALTKEGTLSPQLQAYLAPEWASIPTATGSSAYGQPVKRSSQVSAWFDEGARNAGQVATRPPTKTSEKPENNLNFLNKFIDLLGISGAIQRLGPQPSVQRPEMVDYSQADTVADDSQLLLELYKDSQQRQNTTQQGEKKLAAELQQNLIAADRAKAQLLAQALSAFASPKSVI